MLENKNENVEKTEKSVEEIVNKSATLSVEKKMDAETIDEEKVIVKSDDTIEAVELIEKSIAIDAEKGNQKEEESDVVNYSILSLEELVKELSKTISNNPIHKIKNQVEGVKSAFNQKFGALLAEKKAVFIESGGNSIDFQFSSPIKSEYNSLLTDYKKQRDAHYNDLDKQLSENLEKKLLVIEQLKDLIHPK